MIRLNSYDLLKPMAVHIILILCWVTNNRIKIMKISCFKKNSTLGANLKVQPRQFKYSLEKIILNQTGTRWKLPPLTSNLSFYLFLFLQTLCFNYLILPENRWFHSVILLYLSFCRHFIAVDIFNMKWKTKLQ